MTAVSVEEIRQALYSDDEDDDSQRADGSSRFTCELQDSDSELSLPQGKVRLIIDSGLTDVTVVLIIKATR